MSTECGETAPHPPHNFTIGAGPAAGDLGGCGGTHHRDGRRVPGTEVTVEAFGGLAEAEFRHITETLLGLPRERWKDSGHYHFGPMAPGTAGRVCAYLRTLAIAYDEETTRRWTP